MLGTKMHGRRYTEREIIVQSHLAKHTNRKARTPAVSVANNLLGSHATILIGDGLHTDILEFQVLQMGANQYAKMHGAQVYIGLILHTTVALGNGCQRANYHNDQCR